MKELSGLSLSDILPSSIASDPQVKAAAQALDPELQSVSRDIREVLILPRIDELSEPVVDLLAWQWHVDFYELARTLEMKRAMVKDSIAWHRKKGTKWAIKKALEMIGVEAEVIEWWKIEGAKPYTFAVMAKITDDFYLKNPDWQETTQSIRRAIEESKAARSWLLELIARIEEEILCEMTLGLATFWGGLQKIGLPHPEFDPTDLTAGIATARGGRQVIGLPRPEPGPLHHYGGIATLQVKHIVIGIAPEETRGAKK